MSLTTEPSPPSGAARRARPRRIGPLDGLRGVALVAVLAYHVAPGTFRGGFLGVECFFVLSGYLLTSLLLAEHRRAGDIDKRAFAMRRVRRLAPALLALLLGLALLAPLLAADDAHRLPGDIWSSLLGVTNWHLIADGSSYFSHLGRPPLVRHLWSIAIEIQFYVVCPFLVAWLVRRSRRTAIAALAAGMALSSLLMAVLYRSPNPSRAYYGTDTRVGALLAGVLLAVLLTGDAPVHWRRWMSLGATVAAAGFVALVVGADASARWLYPLGFLGMQAATALIIVGGRGPGRVSQVLGHGSLRWLGERSYGIYLWHWPALMLLRPHLDVSWPPVLAYSVSIAAAILLGSLSHGLVERPFIRPPRPTAQPTPSVVARLRLAIAVLTVLALIVAVARLPRKDGLAESLRAGERVVTAEAPPTTAASSTTVTTLAPAVPVTAAAAPPAVRPVAAATPALPPGPPPGSVPVTAIGDSVMLGAAGALHARLGASGRIDARQGRQFDEGVQRARELRQAGQLGRVVIVHLGNNGPVKPSQLDAMMHELASVPYVLLVTVHVDTAWQGSVNQTLHDGAQRYPSVTLVDWYGYSNGHPEWFWSDGTHLRPQGATAYANLLASAIPSPPPPTTTAPPPTTTTTTAAPPPTTTTTAAPPPTTTTTAAPPPPARVP